ncbi:hypothetical protein M3D63_09285 [Kocuria palustris]|uniref:hypothetical protein n=1 Tax=Kocuria palustris TaxID=71999 RepID=UPI0021A893E4|nr:hypothetical protein [Kocuria palustris]MCT1834965.1 hypothetical protein [Kocuria palustris]
MAFVRERPRKDGTTAFVVQWVEFKTVKRTTRTLATRRNAEELWDFLNANGNSFALAAQASSRLRPSSPTVDAVLTAHIDQLTAIGLDTRARYRAMAARHIVPVLGAVPVDTLTRRDVAAWLNGMAGAAKNQEERPGAALRGAEHRCGRRTDPRQRRQGRAATPRRGRARARVPHPCRARADHRGAAAMHGHAG